MNGERISIGTRDLAGVFWRSFLLQASWNFERMQSLGFAFAMLPVLRRLYPDAAQYVSRVREHMTYFNTQPYMASFVLGAVSRREQDLAAGRRPPEDIAEIKTALAGPLGALGDGFFWGGIKPLAAVLAAAFLLPGMWWAPLFYLVFYNIWHVGARAWLLLLGYRSDGDISAFLGRYPLPAAAQVFKAMTLGVIGCLLGLAAFWMPNIRLAGSLAEAPQALLALTITMTLAAVLRKGGSPIKLMFILAVASLALTYAGVDLL